MTSEEATATVIDALETLEVPYMLVGSLASNFYGIPRATQDADFVVELQRHTVAAIAEHLGPRFEFDRQLTFEAITATTRYVVEVAEISFRVEFFVLSDDPHDQQRFERRRRIQTLGREVFILTVEDVIITKLRWSRASQRGKDVDDVRNVIAVQRDRIQWDYVTAWCDRHGTRDVLESIRTSIPPV